MEIHLQLEPNALAQLSPLLLIGGFAFIVLLWDTLLRPANRASLLWLSLTATAGAVVLSAVQWFDIGSASHYLFSGRLVVDRFSIFFQVLFLLVTGLVLLISREYLEREEINIGEYYSLTLFALFGMMVLSMAADLIMVFLGIEVMSIAIYALAAYNRSNYRCIEGALKYFILGSFASAFLLYGIALIYGQSGTTSLAGIRDYLLRSDGGGILVPVAVGLLLVGFAFKVGAVPFHMWAPDVYEGAATPVTAFMATGVKAAAFSAVVRAMMALSVAKGATSSVIWAIAALTIVIGNVAAIRQTNVKRMLAYSSVGHSGYLVAGLLVIQPGTSAAAAGVSSLLFYLAAYVFMNLGAFAIIVLIGRREEEPLLLENWSGLGFRYPWLGAAMSLFMLSLGGLPPTAGFLAKFYLFSSILNAGYTDLVILAVVTSAASFYFYLRVVVYMYMHPGEEKWSPAASPLTTAAITIAVVATLWLGLLPSGPISFLQWARDSVAALI